LEPAKSYKPLEFPVGSQIKSYITYHQYAYKPSKFFVGQTREDDRDAIIDQMAASISCAPRLESPYEGMPCLVRRFNGKNWARAEVIQVQANGDLRLYLVDYGIEEEKARSKKDLRDIPTDLLKFPVLSAVCRITGVSSKTGKWSQRALKLFENRIFDSNWKVSLFCVSRKMNRKPSSAFPYIHEVAMTDAGGKDVSELLLGLGDDDAKPDGKLSSSYSSTSSENEDEDDEDEDEDDDGDETEMTDEDEDEDEEEQ